MEALRKAEKKIRFIHVRHEESAVFMACAYAKFTGRLGVCLTTSGPGDIHLLNVTTPRLKPRRGSMHKKHLRPIVPRRNSRLMRERRKTYNTLDPPSRWWKLY
jgi:hypothetical protein